MASIDCDTFVKSLLGVMWMLNDIPRPMRRELDTQLGLVWLLISDPTCFPSISFTEKQQRAICEALERCSPSEKEFKYTYDALVQNAAELKLRQEEPTAAAAAAAGGDEDNEQKKEEASVGE